MEIIDVQTPRGIVLKGAMWGNNSMDTVVIMMSGICSNVFQNELLPATGKKLEENGIAFIAGHAMDAFSFLSYSNTITHKQTTTGVVTDDFSIIYEDVNSYLNYAREQGFKKIILAGHSLGSNKIINYLANTPNDDIESFIITAPIDLAHFFNILPEKEMYLREAQKFIDAGRENDILPFLFMGFSPMTARTLMRYYTAENLKNCPVISNDGETDSLSRIKISGSFIIGSKDSMTNGDATGFMEKINFYCKFKNENTITTIPDASHIFYGKHEEYASEVLKCVEQRLRYV